MIKQVSTLALLIAASVASALPLDVSADTSAGANGTWTLDSVQHYSFVGRLSMNYLGTTYLGFCTDATTDYDGSNNDYILTLSTFLPAARRNEIAYLTNHYTAGVSGGTGAALQLAVWDALYDTAPGDVTTGNFVVNSLDGYDSTQFAAVVSQANSFLADSSAHATVLDTSLYFQPTETNQSFVSPVPEPSIVAGLGLGIVALMRRRRK